VSNWWAIDTAVLRRDHHQRCAQQGVRGQALSWGGEIAVGTATTDWYINAGGSSSQPGSTKSLSNAGVLNIVKKAINGGSFPNDPNALYLVFTDPTIQQVRTFLLITHISSL